MEHFTVKQFPRRILFLLLSSQLISGNYLYEETERFISGAHKTSAHSSPVFYNTFLPLVYEFNLPKWDAHTMKIQFWKLNNNCTISDQFSTGYPCPIMFHMNKIIDSLAKNFTVWENIFLPSRNFTTDNSINNFKENAELCWKIVSHFGDFQMSTKNLDAYLAELKNCPLGDVAIQMAKGDLVYGLEEMYHKTFEAYTNAYYSLISEPTNMGMALNSWTALESSLLLNTYVESARWTNALSSCQAKRIPYSLIDAPSFEKVMTSSVLDKVSKKGYKLSIPVQQLSSYFKLPLTDCVFTSNKYFFVRILIPVTKSEADYSLLQLHPIPFWKRLNDEKSEGELCSIEGIGGNSYVSEKKSGFLQKSKCESNELCPVSLSTDTSRDDYCAAALNKDSKKEILDRCSLSCRGFSTDDNWLPEVFSASPSLVFIAGKTKITNVQVECPFFATNERQIIPSLEFGAWNLTIPCNCRLTKHNVPLFPQIPVQQCKNGTNSYDNILNIYPVKPYHWQNFSAVQISHARLFPNTFQRGEEPQLFVSNKSQQGLKHWATVADVNNQIRDSCAGILLQQIFLWVVILFLVFVLAVLSYFVYHLHKWRQNEINRLNRLVYSAGMADATDMTERF